MICPYCGSPVECVDSAKIYGRSYGWAWVCTRFPECDSYVGCHPNTKKPLGRPADRNLRAAKSAAHRAFDALWKAKISKSHCAKIYARGTGYRWLAWKMGITKTECHIGMMDTDMCLRVVAACKPYFEARNK